MDVHGRRVAVVGVGVSNTPLIRYLVQKGARVTACDKQDAAQLGERYAQLRALGVDFALGAGYLDPLETAELIFLTPGMKKDLPAVAAARARGAVISGEIPLLLRLCRAPVIGITGSAGKTTTTALVGRILAAAGRQVYVGGNIGQPLIEQVESIPADAVVVLELSSFQLELVDKSPHIGALLNLSPNHLDIHGTYAAYTQAKARLLAFQGPGDWAVLNADRPDVAALARTARGQVALFSLSGEPGDGATGAWLRGDEIVFRYHGQDFPITRRDAVRLPGRHNLENVLAAVTIASLAGASAAAARQVAAEFSGVEHRLETVAERGGVRWINDSIATAPDRTAAALRTVSGPVLLIAGGYDKHLPFAELAPLIVERVKTLVLLGDTRAKIREAVAAAAAGAGPEIVEVDDLAQAVSACRERARPGDAVLLSPACASYGLYQNFEERGRHFKQLVTAG